jgi:hypothetical protein
MLAAAAAAAVAAAAEAAAEAVVMAPSPPAGPPKMNSYRVIFFYGRLSKYLLEIDFREKMFFAIRFRRVHLRIFCDEVSEKAKSSWGPWAR